MDAVEEVKSKLAIEDIVSEYVELKRSGRNFKGLSPFANEKTPSFMVSPEKQIFHDFSSGKGGDMFTFIMEVEGLDFRGALEHLARKAGVDLEQFRGSKGQGRGQSKEKLYEINELAAKFYQAQLRGSKIALDYLLNKRAFTKQTVMDFRLGYSPNTGDALLKFLRSKGFKDEDITKAGLATKRYRGTGDMFRGRMMVPLSDAQGRVVGFTARLLTDDKDAPKYINTPQTLLYDKGRQVYGLHMAKESVRKDGFVVVVEGNLDVVASHQAGIANVVAAAGTALTEFHLKSLSRFTQDVRFAFDSDRAGVAATERAIPLAQKTDVNVSIITIPGGKDPDELVRKDPQLWRDAIASNQYAVDWLVDRYKSVLDIESGQGKRQFTDIVLKVIRGLKDEVERDHYVGELAILTGVSKEAMTKKLNNEPEKLVRLKDTKKPAAAPSATEKIDRDAIKNQQHMLSLLIVRKDMRARTAILQEDMFDEPLGKELFTFLQNNPEYDVRKDGLVPLSKADPAPEMHTLTDYVKIRVMQYEEIYTSLKDDVDFANEAALLQGKIVDSYVKRAKQKIREQLPTADAPNARLLLVRDGELNMLLRQAKTRRS